MIPLARRPLAIGPQAPHRGTRRAGRAGLGTQLRFAAHCVRHHGSEHMPRPLRTQPRSSRPRGRSVGGFRGRRARERGTRRHRARKPAQERDHRPDLVVACCAAHAGMPVYLMPCLTIQNSSRSRHGRIRVARSGGGGSMARRNRTDRHARRSMTERAAAMEMPGAERHEVGIVQRRRFDTVGMGLHGIAHREGQEPFDNGPVPAARRDAVAPDQIKRNARTMISCESGRARA